MDKIGQTESPRQRFEDTEWSLVLKASGQSVAGRKSMADLCRRYWLPLYVYVRRRGFSHHDAEDLTQGFFAHVLENSTLAEVDPSRGRFRTFLLTALRNYTINQYVRGSAKKRGGNTEIFSIDQLSEESEVRWADRAHLSPDEVFDRTWALAVLEQSLHQLERLLASEGKTRWFKRVRPFLQSGVPQDDYDLIAKEFGMTRNAVAVAIHRLHHRYRNMVRANVAETVANRADAEAEMNYLLASLSR